jgi:hypothetical protein
VFRGRLVKVIDDHPDFLTFHFSNGSIHIILMRFGPPEAVVVVDHTRPIRLVDDRAEISQIAAQPSSASTRL